MGMIVKETEFTTAKEILAFPDHFVAVSQYVKTTDSALTTVGTRKILKAGTVYPTNNDKAIGVVLQDYDVTDGDVNAALIIHGFVLTKKMPAKPKSKAVAALPLIKFLGQIDTSDAGDGGGGD